MPVAALKTKVVLARYSAVTTLERLLEAVKADDSIVSVAAVLIMRDGSTMTAVSENQDRLRLLGALVDLQSDVACNRDDD